MAVKSYYMSPERFHLRMTETQMLPIAGEDLFAGIQYDSSDVGRHLVLSRFFIYKRVCTNGLCIAKGSGILFEQKHIGITREDFAAGFKESLDKFSTLREHAVELISDSIHDTNKYAVHTFTEEQLNSFLSSVRARTVISEDDGEKLVQLMQDKYGESRWGLINSLTEIAQEYTLERRIAIENAAGSLLVA
jgi:hypothetical protein